MTYSKKSKTGAIFGVLAYSIWGSLPLYWRALTNVPPLEILCHRIIWSFVFVFACIIVLRQLPQFAAVIKQPKKLFLLACCSLFISINWGVYIWAVNNGYLLESSLGYYINPLMSVILGMVFLHERSAKLQYASFLLAGAGVVYMALNYGHFPYIALILSSSFAVYGLIKKYAAVDPLVGLVIETMVAVPFAGFYLVRAQLFYGGALGRVGLGETFMLVFAGVVTAVPLLCFAAATNRIQLSALGFIQYISPTITLLLGVFVYHEAFTAVHAVTFAMIWTALIIFSIPIILSMKPAAVCDPEEG